jgi:hypothetical protein
MSSVYRIPTYVLTQGTGIRYIYIRGENMYITGSAVYTKNGRQRFYREEEIKGERKVVTRNVYRIRIRSRSRNFLKSRIRIRKKSYRIHILTLSTYGTTLDKCLFSPHLSFMLVEP